MVVFDELLSISSVDSAIFNGIKWVEKASAT